MNLHKMELKKMIGPMKDMAAIFLGNEQKTFVMYIGHPEAAAILRELQGQTFVRPLTHDLLQYTMIGFDIELKHVIISSIRDNTFYASLVMEQRVIDKDEQWTGKRNEVRIDARPSDSIIMALKFKKDIYVTDEVLQSVKDVTEDLKQLPTMQMDEDTQSMDFGHYSPDEAEPGQDDQAPPDEDEEEGPEETGEGKDEFPRR